MRFIKAALTVLALIAMPVFAQPERGKAELSVGAGKIVVDYGRPQLKGRDPLTWQQDGSYWRMGSNAMTTINTPVELTFDGNKLPKGVYGIWLLKESAEKYALVFNSESTGMGMNHDKSKDVTTVPLRKETLSSPVETFTIDLARGSGGGTLSMSWGKTRLSADFKISK